MNAFLNKHAIRPVIEHTYAFEDAHKAFEHLARGTFGKVVIKVFLIQCVKPGWRPVVRVMALLAMQR
jgi:hypothetical protein